MSTTTREIKPKAAPKKQATVAKEIPTASTAAIKTITLPVSGGVVEVFPFKGKHLRLAQQMAGGDESKLQYAMICACVTVNGKKIFVDDIDQMEIKDVIELTALIGENFI